MLEAEARMTQEGSGQRRLPTDTSEAAAQWPTQTGQIRRTHVGEFASLHVAPTCSIGFNSGAYAGQRSTVSQARCRVTYAVMYRLV